MKIYKLQISWYRSMQHLKWSSMHSKHLCLSYCSSSSSFCALTQAEMLATQAKKLSTCMISRDIWDQWYKWYPLFTCWATMVAFLLTWSLKGFKNWLIGKPGSSETQLTSDPAENILSRNWDVTSLHPAHNISTSS